MMFLLLSWIYKTEVLSDLSRHPVGASTEMAVSPQQNSVTASVKLGLAVTCHAKSGNNRSKRDIRGLWNIDSTRSKVKVHLYFAS